MAVSHYIEQIANTIFLKTARIKTRKTFVFFGVLDPLQVSVSSDSSSPIKQQTKGVDHETT